jgi:hypothetical protein
LVIGNGTGNFGSVNKPTERFTFVANAIGIIRVAVTIPIASAIFLWWDNAFHTLVVVGKHNPEECIGHLLSLFGIVKTFAVIILQDL